MEKQIDSRSKSVLLVGSHGTFKHIEQQDVALIQNVRRNSLIWKWRNNKGLRKIVASNDKFSVVGEQWFQYYRSLNEQKEITYDKREEQLKIIVRWIGDKSCLI